MLIGNKTIYKTNTCEGKTHVATFVSCSSCSFKNISIQTIPYRITHMHVRARVMTNGDWERESGWLVGWLVFMAYQTL